PRYCEGVIVSPKAERCTWYRLLLAKIHQCICVATNKSNVVTALMKKEAKMGHPSFYSCPLVCRVYKENIHENKPYSTFLQIFELTSVELNS
ncbi:MAG: hypothetical protein ACPGD6_08510, partial [bacterium]